MKKFCVMCAAVAAVTAVAALSLAGCGGKKTDPQELGTETGTYRGLSRAESVYGLAAVTTAKLLEESSAGGAQSVAFTDASGSPDAVDKAKGQAEDFNKYFAMLDGFLDADATTTVVENNASEDAALKDYTYKLTVTGKDAAGGDVSHTVYYSETEGDTKQTSRQDDDETVTISSTVYTLEGVVDMGGGVFYHMQGTRTETETTETEGRETETKRISSLSMQASLAAGDTSDYVLLTHTQTSEEETGEAETEAIYKYTVYENGAPVQSTQVSFETETEHGEEETEYTVEFLSGASRGKYIVERETENGKTEIAVSYAIDGATGTFVIVKDAGGAYRYKFSSNPDDDLLFDD